MKGDLSFAEMEAVFGGYICWCKKGNSYECHGYIDSEHLCENICKENGMKIFIAGIFSSFYSN